MRLLGELLPPEKSIPSRRGPYLRSRLHGTDIDAFAPELARLSLSLTDIPNPDGWDLSNEDVFVASRLGTRARSNTIVLANPPFENFSLEQRNEYALRGVHLDCINKASEVVQRTVSQLSPGSVFGFVVPQGLLPAPSLAPLEGSCLTSASFAK